MLDFRQRVFAIHNRALWEGLHIRELGLEPFEFARYVEALGALAVYEQRRGIIGVLGDLTEQGERLWVYPAE